MMHKSLKTTNMILYCKEWEKTVRFYRDQLHLPVNFSANWFVEFRLTENSRLSIADEKRSSIKSCGGKGVTLALEVEDIERMKGDMETIGLKPTVIKKHPWNAWVFYLFDPEGHRIEIWQKTAGETKDNFVC
jgi:predicted enzyme related to lactoylglutathione lyase